MQEHSTRKTVLFLCTGNSCRSQMAEGWTRHLFGDQIEALSAGIETHGLNPRAVQVMREAGVDISEHQSELVDTHLDRHLDLVVTVCDSAAESCPVFPGDAPVVHHPFTDPAKAEGSEEEILDQFRVVRDAIRSWVRGLPRLLGVKAEPS